MENDFGRSKKMSLTPRFEGDWSRLAETVLEAEIKDDVEYAIQEEVARRRDEAIPNRENRHMRNLAITYATTMEELIQVKDTVSEEVWEQKRWERLVRMQQIRERVNNYDLMATLAMEKIVERIESGHIKESAELLGIIAMSERQAAAIRGGFSGSDEASGRAGQSGINIQINNAFGKVPNGDLPGAGNLGYINLSLSHRIVQQLGQVRDENSETESENYLNTIEMLKADEVPLLLQHGVVDKKKENES